MPSPRKTKSPRAKRASYSWRSGLEKDFAAALTKMKVKFTFEERKIKYVKPKQECTYTPDFELENGIIIETKGRFVSDDRKKHLLVKEQHPELDIRFIFSNSRSKLYKGSKSTYGSWCEQHGFQYHDKEIPIEWLKEKKK